MRILSPVLIGIGLSAAALTAQTPSRLEIAQAMDGEIRKLKDLPDEARERAIKDLALRIRRQPRDYLSALSFNLAIEATGAADRETEQEVANTLIVAMQKSRPEFVSDDSYRVLAEMARYDHMQVAIEDPRYPPAMAKLEADDRFRSQADFTLTDIEGRKWNLKSQRGKVVLVNFWATWCPPCRAEIPDLVALDRRFRDRGLEILSISDEEASVLRPFIAEQKIAYAVLLDPGHTVRDQFRTNGVPKSFVYDREGHIAAEAIDRPSMRKLLEMLAQADLQ